MHYRSMKKYIDAGIISDCPYGLLEPNERKHTAMSINACMVHYISSVHHYYYNVTTNPSRTYFVRFCLINLRKKIHLRYVPSIWNSLYIFKRAPQNRVPFSKGLFSSQVKDVSSNTKERSSATTKSNSVSKYTKKIF